MAAITSLPAAAAIAFAVVVAYLYRVNMALKVVPEKAAQAAPRRWTRQQIREAYKRVKQKPIDFASHLPPRLDRRYIVFGGSGELSERVGLASAATPLTCSSRPGGWRYCAAASPAWPTSREHPHRRLSAAQPPRYAGGGRAL